MSDITKTPQVATLDDLKRMNIDVIVPIPGGDELVVQLKTLSRLKMIELVNTIALPEPPISGYDKHARPILNFQESNYLAAQNVAIYNRNVLLLVNMLRLDIPGETNEEKIAYVNDEFDGAILEKLFVFINGMFGEGKARLAGRVATFLGGRHPDTVGNEPNGDDLSAVA